MRLLEYLKRLEQPPAQVETFDVSEITEAAAEMLDIVLPGIEALAGVQQHCKDLGLSEETTDELMRVLVRRYVEQM